MTSFALCVEPPAAIRAAERGSSSDKGIPAPGTVTGNICQWSSNPWKS